MKTLNVKLAKASASQRTPRGAKTKPEPLAQIVRNTPLENTPDAARIRSKAHPRPAVISQSTQANGDAHIVEEIKKGVEDTFDHIADELGIDRDLLKSLMPEIVNRENLDESLKTLIETSTAVAPCMYVPLINTCVYNKDLINQIPIDLKNIGAHEGVHAVYTLLRTKLNARDRIKAIEGQIKHEIENGRSGMIASSYGMLAPPLITSESIRKLISTFFSRVIRSPDLTVKRTAKLGNIKINYRLIKKKALKELIDTLKNHKDYNELIAQSGRNETYVFKQVKHYLNAQIFRYDFGIGRFGTSYIPQEVAKKLERFQELELKPDSVGYKTAIKSTREFISAAEGTRLIGPGVSPRQKKTSQLKYSFSWEEVRARNRQIDNELKDLRKEIRAANLSDNDPELQELKARKRSLETHKRINQLGEELMPLRDRLSVLPQRIDVLGKSTNIARLRGKIISAAKQIDKVIDSSSSNDQVRTEELKRLVKLRDAIGKRGLREEKRRFCRIGTDHPESILEGIKFFETQFIREISYMFNIQKRIAESINKKDTEAASNIQKALERQKALAKKLKEELETSNPIELYDIRHRLQDPGKHRDLLAKIDRIEMGIKAQIRNIDRPLDGTVIPLDYFDSLNDYLKKQNII